VSRLWEILTRQPPRVAPADSHGAAFGFVVRSDQAGWTVMAHGADGRRLGRDIKGLSDPVQATLTRLAAQAESAADSERLARAWTEACRHSTTNADVLTAFADAATGKREDEPRN
jgi:hypothetical protein